MNNLETLLGLVYGDGDGSGGGGGGGTTNYNMLSNRPKINGTTLEGNKTGAELGLASADELQTKASQADLNTLDQETAASIERITQDLATKADATELDNFYNKAATNTLLDGKQDALTAGQNITITKDAQTGETTISATGDVSVDWAEITNKPTNLATTEDVNAKMFVAKYGTTTAQEIIAHLDAANEPFAPMVIERGGQYYTVTTAAKQNDESVIIRSFATLSGNYYMFTYTVTNGSWVNTNQGFQPLLVSGTNIKTVNGESILGAGDIELPTTAYVDTGLAAKADATELDNFYNKAATNTLLDTKQDALTAGQNITITKDAQTGETTISASGGGSITVDDALDDTSTNPVQNMVITEALANALGGMTALETRIAALEAKLAGYEETRLQMTDGTTTTDKTILSKPYETATP